MRATVFLVRGARPFVAACLPVCLTCLLATPARPNEGAEGDEGHEGDTRTTLVVGERTSDDAEERLPMATGPWGPSPEEALEAFGGLTLLRTGGPLAPVRPEVRGLTGPRIEATLGGLPLGSPSSGDVDVGLVPWVAIAAAELDAGAGSSSTALGGTLRLEAIEPLWPRGRARVGVGTLRTFDVGAAIGMPIGVGAGEGAVLAAVSAARTQGDFAYQPTSPTGAVRAPTVRVNNDQARASGFAAVRGAWGGWQARAVGLLAAREGGVPGFAAAPTDGVRGRRAVAGGALALEHPLRAGGVDVVVGLDADARADHRATRAAGVPEWTTVNASALRGAARLDVAGLPTGLGGGAHIDVEAAQVLDHPFKRRAVGGGSRVEWAPFAGFLHLEGRAAFRWLSDIGPLLTAASSAAVGPSWLRLGAGLAHEARAPTLEEMWAPTGLILGNPHLRPESATEAEGFLRLAAGRALDVQAVVFGGRVHDAILLLNRNAFEIAPANTGGIWRAGVEATGSVRPHPWLEAHLGGRWLWSRLDVTGAPMPVAPALAARGSLRLGPPRGGNLVVVLRHRGPTTSNLFGTLEVPGYLLADLVGRWPVGRHLHLEASLTNVFNTLTARDLNGLPLPGRQLFVSVEATL